MEVLLCLKIIVSSMALTMFGGAATMLEHLLQAASYNSTSSSYFDVTPEEAVAFYQSQDYKN